MKFLKEPFTHFVLLGVAIFAWFALANPGAMSGPDSDELIVDQQFVEVLSAQFKSKMNRQPTLGELDALVDQHIRHEVMEREARALGLDQGDGIVRNRLVQKMTFLSTSVAQSAVPDDETLEEYMQENAVQYASSARMSFVQFGLEEGIDGAAIVEILVQLRNGETPTEGGGPVLLPGAFNDANVQQVDGTFGRGFFGRVAELPVGTWSGPVQSGYGLHLVRLDQFQASEPPQLDAVRDDVLFDWRRDLAEQLTDAHVAGLMEGYQITRPSQQELEAWLSQ